MIRAGRRKDGGGGEEQGERAWGQAGGGAGGRLRVGEPRAPICFFFLGGAFSPRARSLTISYSSAGDRLRWTIFGARPALTKARLLSTQVDCLLLCFFFEGGRRVAGKGGGCQPGARRCERLRADGAAGWRRQKSIRPLPPNRRGGGGSPRRLGQGQAAGAWPPPRAGPRLRATLSVRRVGGRRKKKREKRAREGRNFCVLLRERKGDALQKT